jgi:hypothetical protein
MQLERESANDDDDPNKKADAHLACSFDPKNEFL